MTTLRVFKLHKDAIIPSYVYPDDSGMDLFSVEEKFIPIGGVERVKTGISVEVPEGHEIQVRPKSGLSSKGLMTVLGTVDEGYRGEIEVVLYNFDLNADYVVHVGSKIGQMVVVPITRVNVVDMSTARGAKGFGSTGLTAA
jgi:dUTP pyrophosphatase